MLGNEPNQGRVISKNHSIKSKLGTARVWTGEAEVRRPVLCMCTYRGEPKT